MRGASGRTGARKWLTCVLVIAACGASAVRGAQLALPFLSFLHEDHGPDNGGYEVAVVGRNLAFFPTDVDVFVNGRKVDAVKVAVPWERLSVTMPPCPQCGVVPVVVKAGPLRSNPLNFTYTSARCVFARPALPLTKPALADDCRGPVLPPGQPVLPRSFSLEENCTGASRRRLPCAARAC